MKITVQRDTYHLTCTMGEMTIDTVPSFKAYTLELPRGSGLPGSCIPAGTYKVGIYPSPHFKRMMPLIEGIPGRSEIEIHWGNFPRNTEGCILVGTVRTLDAILDTKAKFDELFPLIETAVKGNNCWIEVKDFVPPVMGANESTQV
jgi:Family of unknown function (DUF5675)